MNKIIFLLTKFALHLKNKAGFVILFFLLFSLSTKTVLAQPIPITTDSRIKTLVYNPNEVYQLKFHYGYQSFIEFADDEEIEMISIGESFAWRLTPAGKRLFIRPLEIAAHTNMAVITNKRTYQFDIRSSEYTGKADEELVYTIRFYYPEVGAALPIPPQLAVPNLPPPPPTSRLAVKSPSSPARVDQDLPSDLQQDNINNKLNFEYSLAGNAENITPVKIYDNGRETYFQFKNNNLIIPTISSVDIFGNEKPLSYTIKDNYVMVPAVEIQFTLRLANSLLCVFNNNKKF
jgi:type IV secretion system protein VirB9